MFCSYSSPHSYLFMLGLIVLAHWSQLTFSMKTEEKSLNTSEFSVSSVINFLPQWVANKFFPSSFYSPAYWWCLLGALCVLWEQHLFLCLALPVLSLHTFLFYLPIFHPSEQSSCSLSSLESFRSNQVGLLLHVFSLLWIAVLSPTIFWTAKHIQDTIKQKTPPPFFFYLFFLSKFFLSKSAFYSNILMYLLKCRFDFALILVLY